MKNLTDEEIEILIDVYGVASVVGNLSRRGLQRRAVNLGYIMEVAKNRFDRIWLLEEGHREWLLNNGFKNWVDDYEKRKQAEDILKRHDTVFFRPTDLYTIPETKEAEC